MKKLLIVTLKNPKFSNNLQHGNKAVNWLEKRVGTRWSAENWGKFEGNKIFKLSNNILVDRRDVIIEKFQGKFLAPENKNLKILKSVYSEEIELLLIDAGISFVDLYDESTKECRQEILPAYVAIFERWQLDQRE
ncbi:MAG TPA: hypothetical protein PK720_01545 [bacterium]|nr:hypothetical protein [bacterium]